MAFTSAEKARIRSLGGWGSRWSQTQTRLESAMTAIGLSAPAEEALIQSYLTQLDTLDGLISEAQGLIGVKQTGSIVLDDTAGIAGLRSEGRRLVDAIFGILECDVKRNFYGSGSPRGGQIQYG
jgi:hypothetical protein